MHENEAQDVDLKVIRELEKIGWKVGDSLLYQKEFKLTEEQQIVFAIDGKKRKSIKPDIVLIDPISHDVLAVIENKLEDEKKALSKLRLLYAKILNPRFLYACSKERILFYDMAWRGLEAGEFKRANGFLSLEQMKVKIEQQKKVVDVKEIKIDTTIAGGYDPNVGKERYYQLECINTLIDKYRAGETKMLVHMATGLGKTRTMVALVKALLSHGLARKILFVVDRRMLAKQALDDGFSLISREHSAVRLRTTNFKQQMHAPIHVVVIDTLERIFTQIPSNFYDLLIVDECHRSISINRKLIFDHFLCPRIGLTATPRIAVAKDGADVAPEDLEIRDTYKLFGCESGEPTYKFDLERGIKEGFLAEYNVLEILTHLTREAEDEGIEFDYVLDPDTRKRIDLPKEKRLKLEQLERKYLSEERSLRIAEEIRKHTEYGEKVILFGVSQPHCLMLTNALNKVFNDDGSDGVKYAEAIISDNQELNDFLKSRFKKPFQKPYIAVSVDIMSTGVDVPCVRYIAFASLTKSVGKYIQMIGRGTRLDPLKSGKYSFQVLDFVGLCRRMDDNRKGTTKPNKTIVTGREGTGTEVSSPRGDHFIIDNPDPAEMIQRVYIHGDEVKIIDNIPIEDARVLFEEEVQKTQNEFLKSLIEKAKENTDYQPTDEEIEKLEEWLRNPEVYLDEGQLQKIYQYPEGSSWEFFLHALGIKRIPSPKERIEQGFESFINSTNDFNDEQLSILSKMKDIFASNLDGRKDLDVDSIFSNPIYERLLGSRERIEEIFDGNFSDTIQNLKKNFKLPKFTNC